MYRTDNHSAWGMWYEYQPLMSEHKQLAVSQLHREQKVERAVQIIAP